MKSITEEKNPIDELHDYTHSREFKERVKNEDFRVMIRYLLDMAQRMTNIASAQLPRGIYCFDKIPDEIGRTLKGILSSFNSIRTVKR